jgi:hypothetical protein
MRDTQKKSKFLDFSTIQAGQAVVTLLFFMVLSITVTTAAVMIVLSNAAAASTSEQGGISYYFAESGAEEGLLRLLRNPSYTGETITYTNGSVVISVAGGTITATGTAYNTQRTIAVQTAYNNNVLSVTSWKEL